MTNALQLNESTVVGGLGTQSYTITTPGLYTCSLKAFIPYLASGSPAVTAQPIAEVQNITAVADVSGSLNSTFFTFYDAGNAHGYYVWYNINSAGVDPAPAGLTGIKVSAATGATANTIAADTIAAINAVSGISVVASGSTSHVIITNSFPGSSTAAADGTAATGFSFSVTTAGTFGTPAISGLVIQIKQNSTVLQTIANPTPTQPILNGYVTIQASAADVISVVLSSLSTADNAANSVKTIVNLFQGGGQ